MRYSILVPSYDPQGEKIDMVTNLLRSIDTNSVGEDYEIILRKNGPSYVESHNDALKSARGDYLVILNDDVLIEDKQWLQKLTKPDTITSSGTGTFVLDNSPTWNFDVWCMPRNIFKKIGYFDEAFKDGFNYEDNDYIFRAKELNIPFEKVELVYKHFGGETYTRYYKDKELAEHNKQVFIKKWKM